MYHGAEIANKNYKQQVLAVGATALQAIGDSSATVPQTGRKYLHLWNITGKAVFWSLKSTLTRANCLTQSTGVIADGAEAILPYGPNLTVYLVTQSGTSQVSVTEII